MCDQKIAYSFVFDIRLPVELSPHDRIEALVGKIFDEPADGVLDQRNGGGFQRLKEPSGKPDGDAVALPLLLPAARREAQRTRVGKRLAIEICQ